MATSIEEKVRENRMRRMAQRQGLFLRKSGRRDPMALDYGKYWLDLADDAASVAAAPDIDRRTGWDLDQVERYLTRGES